MEGGIQIEKLFEGAISKTALMSNCKHSIVFGFVLFILRTEGLVSHHDPKAMSGA